MQNNLSREHIVDTIGRDFVGDRQRWVTVTLETAKVAARSYREKRV